MPAHSDCRRPKTFDYSLAECRVYLSRPIVFSRAKFLVLDCVVPLSCSHVVQTLMLKVLHVIPSVSDKDGGPTYAVQAFARAVQECSVEVLIATTDDDGGRHRLRVSLNEPIERRGTSHRFFRRNLLVYKISMGLARWLGRNVKDFDLVHIHALFSFSSFAAARAARRAAVPYIVRPLGVLNRWGMENRRPFLKRLSLKFVELPILRGAAAIHYTTEAERDEAGRLRPEIAALPSFILPIPVEPPPNAATPEQFLNRFPAATSKKVVLFLSRLDPKKGLELLLHGFARVKTTHSNLILVIAGTGNDDYVRSLHNLAKELGIDRDVLWTGHLAGQEKAAALAAATLFVLPSYSENFGIAAAEAMAAGVPTVITDQVALSEYATEHDAAVVVPPEKQALSAALNQIIDDEPLRQKLATNARAMVKELYSSQVVGAKLAEHYRRIVDGAVEKKLADRS
jgi:glycosyltransferase involved in cell wall biosynthesis